ncbi:hypothetical protein WBJ53_04750 [Spirosoma sp. SC4-14]|uniref:hypothetical protein n=1 Tax=Spirosoma sp. SC4-14 TaxID=3128900 RepID=UPI0030D1D0FC
MNEQHLPPVNGPALKEAIGAMENVGFIEFAAFLIYCQELKLLGFREAPLWSKLEDNQKQKYLRIADKQFVNWKLNELEALQSQLERYENWVNEGLGE